MELVKETLVTLAKEPRVRVIIAFNIAAWPVCFGGLVWLSALDFSVQIMVGAITGLAIMIGFHYLMLHRTHSRMREAVKIQQLSGIDAGVLKRLLPPGSIPTWMQSGFDKVDWLNKELIEIWPFLDKAVGDIAVQKLQPILDQHKLGPITSIKVKQVTLGSVSPLIGGFKITEAGKDESMVEVELDWRKGKGQKVVIKVGTIGPDFDVEINNFTLYGVARVILKPLLEEIPGFGAILVSLREPPKLSLDVRILGGDLTALPGVDNMIENVVVSALEDTLVWPSRIVVPIAPGDYSYLELHAVGILQVILLEATDVKSNDWFGKSDPFVMIYVRSKQDKIKRSSTKSNKSNPVWNEGFDVEVEDPECQKLNIRLMDSDALSGADFYGGAELPIKQFEPWKEFDMWVQLSKDPKKPQEEKLPTQLHLIFTYKPLDQLPTHSSVGGEQVVAPAGGNEKEQTEGKNSAADEPAKPSAENIVVHEAEKEAETQAEKEAETQAEGAQTLVSEFKTEASAVDMRLEQNG